MFSSWSDGGAQSHKATAAVAAPPFVATFEALPACSDGIDNDGDGQADFPNDPGCFQGYSGNEAPACSDGLDNDGDGKRDWDGAGVGAADPECYYPYGVTERPRACGLGFELVLLAPLALRLRRLRGRRG